MEPWVCTSSWQTDTLPEDRLAMNMSPGSIIQLIVGGSPTATVHPQLGPLADVQGTFLPWGQSLNLPAGTPIHRRIYTPPGVSPSVSAAAIGFNPVV